MNIFAWFRTLWQNDAIYKATKAATTLVAGLSTDQFQLVVDKVAQVGKEQISGLEKAAKVKDIITNPAIVSAYKLPDWANQGINFASTIVQLAWVVAKITKRI
jgi:hypothetical protein